LACGDQRRLTGNGSALEVVLHDYALYKSTFTLLYLLYFMRIIFGAEAEDMTQLFITPSCHVVKLLQESATFRSQHAERSGHLSRRKTTISKFDPKLDFPIQS